jgi:aspartate aminotransferase
VKTAICQSLQRDYDLAYEPAEVTASCGAKQALFNVFMALLDEGDEVIIPARCWVSYPEQERVAGAPFGSDGHIRFSDAISLNEIRERLRGMQAAVSVLATL